jgi:sensor c-di-GMP phosphodiesterase-like protein
MPSSELLDNWKRRLPVTGMLSVIAALLFLFGTWQLRERFFGLRAEIRQAAALLQFQPYFQPVINVRTGACEGAELLVRWIHPKRGVVPPGLFIPEAEASGLIEDLTLSMLRREAVAIRDLLRKYDELHLNLNLSATMLDDARFITRIAEALGDLNIVRRFHFELTESVSADENARRRLIEYKEFGIRLAVDDFGTGYSNLRYLKDFPFDYLKIDKAFVDGISSASESSGLIDSIIVIGKNCGMHLIAEGVERAEQLEYLRTHDVQSAQGYLISRPVPIEDFAKWLEARKAAS